MKLPKYDSTLEKTAAHYAGNHRQFSSFSWGAAPADAAQWAILYTTNRDADALTRSNHEEIARLLAPFLGADAEPEDHSHWAVGWVAGFSVRVYSADGAVTPAFKTCFEIMQRLENYCALNEDRWSELESEEHSDCDGCDVCA